MFTLQHRNFVPVSNIAFLLEQYRNSTPVKKLADELNKGTRICQIDGTSGAQNAFLIAAVAATRLAEDRIHLVICESKEEGAYLYNDLTSLLGDQQVLFFPDSFKRPSFFEELHPTQVLQRSETVNKITSPVLRTPTSSPIQVIVTYPESLFEQVVNPAILAQKRISVVAGEKLDADFVIEVLIEYGFERTDFVYEPGQFSIRGGIIDLYSYGNELPYRIELFDEEVESIRTFDPLSQLSNQKIASVSIIPNLNTRFSKDQKVSLFKVIPIQTVIWIKDFQFLLDSLQNCFDRAGAFAEKIASLESAEVREMFKDRAFVYPGQVIEDVAESQIIYLEKQRKGAAIA